MRVDDALGPRGSAGGEWDGKHVVFISGVGVKAIPTFGAMIPVMLEAFQDGLVVLTA